ncbi:hypothetical protein C0J52_00745 [Blattella germanica]|nr:hypothetical protein C0J52_00745 [Blattella germanica]
MFHVCQGPPNVILARDWNNAWCVAQGEEVFSGLTWNSPVKPSVCLQEIALNTKHMVKMEQAAKTNTILHPLRGEKWDGLIDYRWNGTFCIY